MSNQISTNDGAQSGASLSPGTGSVKWIDPHFQLAAEHFGYVPDAETAEDDREVIALADFLRVKIGEWTVRKSDYDKLATAAKWLRRSCRDRLPPGHYAKLEDECRALDAIFSPNDQAHPRRGDERDQERKP